MDVPKPATLLGPLAYYLPFIVPLRPMTTVNPALSLPTILPCGDPVWNAIVPGHTSYTFQTLFKGFGPTLGRSVLLDLCQSSLVTGSWLRCGSSLGRVAGGRMGTA